MKLSNKIQYITLITSICLILPIWASCQTANTPITLTWSTDTYIPANYVGKAIPTVGSKIEVVATIDNPAINPFKTTYEWSLSRDFYPQEKISELGKQTYTFNIGDNIYQNYSVNLELKNDQGEIIGKSETIFVKPYKPQIIIHPMQISNGIKKTLPSFDASDLNLKKYLITSNQAVEFTAIPYFFNIKNIDDLDYNWQFGTQNAAQKDSRNLNIFKLKIGKVANTLTQNLQLFTTNRINPLQYITTNAQIILNP